MTCMHEDTHFNPKSLNIRTYCKMLSKSIEIFTRSAKSLQRRLKLLRTPRNAFKGVWNLCALREMPSKAFETSARSAKCFQRRLKLSCAPRNAFKGVWNFHALCKIPSEPSETFTLSKTKGNPYSLNHPNLCEGLPTCWSKLTLKTYYVKWWKCSFYPDPSPENYCMRSKSSINP